MIKLHRASRPHLHTSGGDPPAMAAHGSLIQANHQIAERLREMAETLAEQGEDGFRVRAYRNAADVIDGLAEPLEAIVEREGRRGLVALPAIGEGIAGAVVEMLTTGRWAQLERVQGTLNPEQLFRTLPGVGPVLAKRLHEELGVDTLEQLESAVHDGRVEALPGVGPRKAAILRATLNTRLGRLRISRTKRRDEPPVPLLLSIDELYRQRAAAGALRKIAPRRFNPSGEAWLPIMHTEQDGWRFTVLYSNTAQAHERGRTHDWVVVYFHADAGPEGQRTIVTESHGPQKGRRVVRGREAEGCSPSEGA